MTDRENYSFSSHNLQTSSMQQSFNRPAKLLQQREINSAERRVALSSNDTPGSHRAIVIKSKKEESQTSRLIPHPPSSPRALSAVDANPRLAALNSKGVKRLRHESPQTSPSSENESKGHKHAFGVILDPLPLRRRGSTGSLDSVESSESADSPRNTTRGNRNLRGTEPLKDIGSSTEIVSSFKNYQSSAKNDSSKKFTKKNVVHPMRVTQEQNNAAVMVSGHKEAASAKSGQSVSLNDKIPSEDEVTLSSDGSFTSVSESNEESINNSKISERRNQKLATQREPNSTLPTLPAGNVDNTLVASSNVLYESVHPNEFKQDHNSASDLRKLSKALEKVVTNEDKYASDSELSVRSMGEASNLSTLSILPPVCARRARTRSGNFLREEMERYFPDHRINVFVGTWNMHEEKVRCNIL